MDPEAPLVPAPKRPRVGKSKGGRKEIPDAEKRTKRIVLRVTEGTYAELKDMAKASGRPLAVVVRSLTRPQRKGLTPEQFGLLRQLAGMTTNLNQLAKRGHQDGFGAVANQVTQAAAQLSALLNTYTGTAGSDD
ncbi:hypothetical protein GCM10027422_49050 [Hymenobacter arcticus]